MNNDAPEVEDFETRWPKDGDRLFVESTWAYEAHIARNPAERFYRMPMGYKRAGDILIDQAAVDRSDRTNVIYAALFCYRQGRWQNLEGLRRRGGARFVDPDLPDEPRQSGMKVSAG